MNRMTIPAILFALIAFIALPYTSGAATVGNIASSQGGGGGASVGVEYDKVFSRDLTAYSGDRIRNTNGTIATTTYPATGGNVNDLEMESNRVLVKGTLGFHRDIDLDLYLKVGIADVTWKATHALSVAPAQDLEFDGEADLAYGGGARLGFYHFSNGIKIMGDIQYLTYEVSGNFTINGIDRAAFESPATYDTKTKVEEWQGALYVQRFFGRIGPYLGVKYSDVNLENKTNVTTSLYSYEETMNAEAEKNAGAFLGADLDIIPNHLSVNIEVRFVDETSASIGVNYMF